MTDRAIESIQNKGMVVFGGSNGIDEGVVGYERELGAAVFSFSRLKNGVAVPNIAPRRPRL